MGFRNIAGVMTVAADNLTVRNMKRCQQLAPRKHTPDGKAFILLSSPSSIRVPNTSRKFTSELCADVCAGISG
jgi:hypothetical protein